MSLHISEVLVAAWLHAEKYNKVPKLLLSIDGVHKSHNSGIINEHRRSTAREIKYQIKKVK